MFFQTARRLRDVGILGLNQRNNRYTLAYNPRHLYPLVDDKLETKRLAVGAGLAVPELYGVVEIEQQIEELDGWLSAYPEFVVNTALRLAHWFGTSPEFWLNLQASYDLRLAEQEAGTQIRKLPTRPDSGEASRRGLLG